jgi:hypothetical protein
MNRTDINKFYQNHTVDEDFDELKYLECFPDVFDYYQPYCKTENISDKKRLFHHCFIYQIARNEIEDIKVDESFDENFYEQMFPEVKNYYSFWTNIDKAQRLYHHYINYHQPSNNSYCLNLGEFKKQLQMDIEPPESFDPTIYKKLYLSNDLYFDSYNDAISLKQLMYHHYLNYGKAFGHSCDHDMMVFFHIPKCGGTSLHYGTLLPSLYAQYHCNKNYIYSIDWMDGDGRSLFSTISYSDNDRLKFNTQEFRNTSNFTAKRYNQGYLKRITTELNDTNLNLMLNHSALLCVIINAAGFQEYKKHLKNLISADQRYNKYIILREPIDLQMSIFYYLRDVGQWELTYGKFPKHMSFSEYIRHPDNYVNSWLIRIMALLTDQDIPNNEHAEICKQELNTFHKIGFLSYFNNFIDYLNTKYNWTPHTEASEIQSNKNTISKKEKLNDDDLALLQDKLYYEQKIYNHFLNQNISKRIT